MASNADLAQKSSMSDVQKDLYECEDESEVGFPFANDQRKSMSYFPESTMISGVAEGNKFKFNMDLHGKHHLLIASSLNFKTPAVSVKENFRGDYRIRWGADMGFNIVESASLQIDGDDFQTLTASAMKHAEQFCFLGTSDSESKRRIMSQSNGNDPSLVTWSSSLPEFDIISEQPWFYSRGTIIAMPLRALYAGLYFQIDQLYMFDLDISHFLCIQYRDETGEWIDVPFRANQQILEGLPQNCRLPVPYIRGEYIHLGNEAVEYLNECSEKRFREFIVPVFNTYVSKDTKGPGGSLSVEIVNNHPCSALMWSLRNQTRKRFGDVSYYTTKFRNPIKDCTLSFHDNNTKKYLFQDTPISQFSPNHEFIKLLQLQLPRR